MESEFGPLLNGVGKILAKDTAYPIDGTFLYVEADWGWVDLAVFKDLGDQLLCRRPPDELSEALLDLWDAAPEGKRWSTLQYRIDGGRFEATFGYDALDPKVSSIDRREVILRQRYGNKRIVYPPLP